MVRQTHQNRHALPAQTDNASIYDGLPGRHLLLQTLTQLIEMLLGQVRMLLLVDDDALLIHLQIRLLLREMQLLLLLLLLLLHLLSLLLRHRNFVTRTWLIAYPRRFPAAFSEYFRELVNVPGQKNIE